MDTETLGQQEQKQKQNQEIVNKPVKNVLDLNSFGISIKIFPPTFNDS